MLKIILMLYLVDHIISSRDSNDKESFFDEGTGRRVKARGPQHNKIILHLIMVSLRVLMIVLLFGIVLMC